ncbi:4'-phosphopantetheinyl transferase family protein [Streptomyces sp. CB02460]|uniref:4'-phosphopantetheinyl transferase family protein n=1 Tax=Streptomyces sp. CB02460 TaxID=1703941 RepID=UPI00093B1756|nr:4'-phosphopantetheinyl transferase superfamily protein [Streptomyces sp. CB02460]
MTAGLLPAGVILVESFGDTGDAAGIRLFPAEEALIADVVEERRREFTTVRGCAREAMRQLGREPAPLVRQGRDGPVWPEGLVGSLTHCVGYRAAAVAPAGAFRAVGIDAEPDAPLPYGLDRRVLTAGEAEAVAELGRAEVPVAWDRLVFCVKEAVYKAWHPLTGLPLGFLDAEVALSVDGTFTARVPGGPVPGGPPFPELLRGTWAAGRGLLRVGLAVPAPVPEGGTGPGAAAVQAEAGAAAG